MKNVRVQGERGDEGPTALILRRIDEEHSNPLKGWEEMGRPKDLTRQK